MFIWTRVARGLATFSMGHRCFLKFSGSSHDSIHRWTSSSSLCMAYLLTLFSVLMSPSNIGHGFSKPLVMLLAYTGRDVALRQIPVANYCTAVLCLIDNLDSYTDTPILPTVLSSFSPKRHSRRPPLYGEEAYAWRSERSTEILDSRLLFVRCSVFPLTLSARLIKLVNWEHLRQSHVVSTY